MSSRALRKIGCKENQIAINFETMAHIERIFPPGRKVHFMATCLCDAFYDDVAIAAVQVLEHLGCEVEFPEKQTCCGQVGFNAGDWRASRKVVRHTARVFSGDRPVVVPSGSCAAMLFHGAPMEFEGESDIGGIQQLVARTWELADYIVNGLGIDRWPGEFRARIAFHRSCHTRGSESSPAMRKLLGSIAGVELVEIAQGEQCCGFGGVFAVAFPTISAAMGRLKLDHALAADPDCLVSGDMGCLLHLGGMAEKNGRPIKTMHVAQVLRDALKNGGLLK